MNLLTFLLTTTGTTTDTTTSGAGLLGGGFVWIIMIVMMIGMFWWTSRSQKKKDKEIQDMRDSLQIGDEVTTIGGIIGKVVAIKEETFVLETTREGTKIRFLKAAIRSIDVKIADVAAAAAQEKEADAKPAEEVEQPKKKGLFKK